MGTEYINENVLRSINELIGDPTPENEKRLRCAALRATTGVQPISRPLLSKETDQHYTWMLENLSSQPDFNELKDHLAAYIMGSQRDEGGRKK
jgi:hypothetical protein